MINNLLNQVKLILDSQEKITKIKGDNFNLFDIMKMRTNEVKTHSALIAELLRPTGSHNMGSIFLKLFLEKANFSSDTGNNSTILSNIENTNVKVEYSIGTISEDKMTGGRIDILLYNQHFEICIENKINARDQPFQLRRYHNYLGSRNKNKKTKLYYLTLFENSPADESICKSKLNNGKWEEDTDKNEFLEVEKDYFCITYKNTILEWLEECYSLTIDKPILRESLKQYIILVKSLTHQLRNKQMEKELHNSILSNLRSSEVVYNTYFEALNTLILDFCESLKEYLIDNGIGEERIEVRNWKNENQFFTVIIERSNELPSVGFEIVNGNHGKSEMFSFIDFADNNWGKQSPYIFSKNETINQLTNYHNGNKVERELIISEIASLLIESL